MSEPWIETEYWVVDNPLEAYHAIEFLRKRPPEGTLVVDIECGIEKDAGFDHPNRYSMLCIGVGYERKRVIVFADGCLDSGVYDALGSLFRSRKLGGQNLKFDLKGLYPKMGPLVGYFDTMLASYTFDERPGIHGLKHQAVEYQGAPQYDNEIKQYVSGGRSYANIPRSLLYKYNAYDVSCTFDLCDMYEAKFKTESGKGLRRVHDLLMAASNQLMYVELNGIAIDREYLEVLAQEYTERIELLEHELNFVLQRRSGHEQDTINPRSPQQVKRQLLEYRIRVGSTDVDTLHKVLEAVGDNPKYTDVKDFITILLRHRRESKLYGTYIKGTKKRLYRGRVYPTFLLHGTTTGRLACRNPNLQNVPRQSSIRRLYVPGKPGNVFVQVDYSQAELRVLCFLAGDTYFRDIFNAGDRDLFDELTPILYPTANRTTLSPAQWKELRIRVKAYVYGLGYGRTEYSISDEYNIPVEEARAGMAKFFEVIPEIVSFRERTRQSVLAGKYLETPFGRRRRFGLITDENKKSVMNEALAFIPQSTSSDMCLLATTWARKELRGTAFIRNIVHDSMLAECQPRDANMVASTINRLMVASARTIVGDYVTFATDFKVGANWGEV
jgi:DNA polymerase-1